MAGMDDILAPEWLDATMTNAGIKTGQLADVSGVSKSQIQRIRNGDSARTSTLRELRTGIEAILAEKVEVA